MIKLKINKRFPIITSPYGVRDNPLGEGQVFHKGMDFRAAIGSKVTFDVDCKIIVSGSNRKSGNYAVINITQEDQTYRFFLCHLQSKPKKGTIAAGNVVCITGNTGKYTTGAHLHCGVRTASNGAMKDGSLSLAEATRVGYINPKCILTLRS